MGWLEKLGFSNRSASRTIEYDPEQGLSKDTWNALPEELRAVLPWSVYGSDDLGNRANSGTVINEETAMKFGVVYAAVTLIADGVASLPPRAFTELDDGSRTALPVPQWIRRPHPEIRRFDLFSQLLVSVLTWGDGFAAFIRRPSDGVITGLNVIDPSSVTVQWDPDRPGYRRYRIGSTGPWLTSYDIFHIQGPTLPGEAAGMSVIRYAREAIGLGLTLEEYGARYFGQGSQAKIVLEIPSNLDEPKAKDIVRTFERFHRGKNNWHRPAIVSGGAKLHQISIPPDDAQFLQSREHQAIDVARWFRVPPHRVGIVSASTSWGSGLSEENRAMLQHTYRPWITRLQDALTMYAPGGQDLGTIIELETDALLQGTFKEQSDIYTALYEKRIVTKNEARQKLGLPKVPDGDSFFEPAPVAGPGDGGPTGSANPRTPEQDRLRKQEEAARSLLDSLDEEFQERANPYHDKLGKFAPKHGGGIGGSSAISGVTAPDGSPPPAGVVATSSKISGLSKKGQEAIAKNNEKWGISHDDLVKELDSKITPEGLKENGKWYSQEGQAFNKDLAERSGLSLEQVTAITALTSPRTPWVKNKEIAERIALKHKDYDDPDPVVAAKRMGGSLSANMGPAIAVARGDKSPDEAITGMKRKSFYNNMLHPHATDDVTVDTWMQRSAMNATAAKGGTMTLDDSLKYMNANKASTNGAGAGYISIAEATRAVAAKHGVTPDEIQSTYWVAASGHREGLWGEG